MNFLALNDDVKFIISKHLASDLKIRALLSKNHDLQQILVGGIHTYVCMYVCMYVCICIRMYEYIYIYIYIHTHV